MKKKERKLHFIAKNWYIIFLIIAIILAIICFLPYLINDSFKITKEECWNETTDNFEGLENYLHYEIQEHLYERYYDLGCDVLSKYDVLEESKPCTLLEEDINYKASLLNALFEIVYFDRNINETDWEWNDIYETKEICEEVEVDKLEVIVDTFCSGCTEFPFKCQEECAKDGCSFSIYEEKAMYECIDKIDECQDKCEKDLCTFDCEDFYVIRNKEDLTKEFLDENCECLEGCEKTCHDSFETSDELNRCINEMNCPKTEIPHCSKYKCGDYQVEVLR